MPVGHGNIAHIARVLEHCTVRTWHTCSRGCRTTTRVFSRLRRGGRGIWDSTGGGIQLEYLPLDTSGEGGRVDCVESGAEFYCQARRVWELECDRSAFRPDVYASCLDCSRSVGDGACHRITMVWRCSIS